MLVTGIDWHPVTNRIVTCSHDRNAFVWLLDEDANVWRPQVVQLGVNRAATSVRWSPDGERFAVGSSNKHIIVCTYHPVNDWWVGTPVKKVKSTVTAVAWHPSGAAVASGSTDYKCRVTGTPVKGSPPLSTAASAVLGSSLPAVGADICDFGGEAHVSSFLFRYESHAA